MRHKFFKTTIQMKEISMEKVVGFEIYGLRDDIMLDIYYYYYSIK